jgi:hypothetical protein
VKGSERILYSFMCVALPTLSNLLELKLFQQTEGDQMLREMLALIRDFSETHIASLPITG